MESVCRHEGKCVEIAAVCALEPGGAARLTYSVTTGKRAHKIASFHIFLSTYSLSAL